MMRTVLLAAAIAVYTTGSAYADEHSRDAVLIDADSHQVVFENEHVRVIKNHSSPGKTSPMHTHGSILVVSLEHTRLRMSVPEGDPFILDLHPGQVLWLDDPEHSWEVLAGQLHVIGIEVKSATKSD
jgi:hypothetical protein